MLCQCVYSLYISPGLMMPCQCVYSRYISPGLVMLCQCAVYLLSRSPGLVELCQFLSPPRDGVSVFIPFLWISRNRDSVSVCLLAL